MGWWRHLRGRSIYQLQRTNTATAVCRRRQHVTRRTAVATNRPPKTVSLSSRRRTSSRDAGSKMRRTFLPTPFFGLGIPPTPRFDRVVFIKNLRLRRRPPSPLSLPPPVRRRRILLLVLLLTEAPPAPKHVPAGLRNNTCSRCRCSCSGRLLAAGCSTPVAAPLVAEAPHPSRKQQQQLANRDRSNRTDI